MIESWSPFDELWHIFLIGAGGLSVIGAIALRPRSFWPVLIFLSIMGTGPMIGGYGLVDEYLLACVVLGSLLFISIKDISDQGKILTNLHGRVFLVFVIYMTFQSIRGLIILNDWRMLRFIVFFVMLGVVSFLIRRKAFPPPANGEASVLIGLSATLYFLTYLLIGLASENLAEMDRYDLQGHWWTGTTVATFPLYIALPAAVLLVNDRSRMRNWLGWVVVGLLIVTSVYYESRVAWLAIIAFGVTSFGVFGLRRVLWVVLLMLSASLLLTWGKTGLGAAEYLQAFGMALVESILFLVDPRASDFARRVDVMTAFQTMGDSWHRALFGSGFYTHRYRMLSYLEIADEYGVYTKVPNIIRPAAFSAFLVDGGVIGILLLAVNFAMAARDVLSETRRERRKMRGLLLTSIFFVIISLFISTNYDLVLMYLMLMPSGLLVQLVRDRR